VLNRGVMGSRVRRSCASALVMLGIAVAALATVWVPAASADVSCKLVSGQDLCNYAGTDAEYSLVVPSGVSDLRLYADGEPGQPGQTGSNCQTLGSNQVQASPGGPAGTALR
jgi:hypothetical protein